MGCHLPSRPCFAHAPNARSNASVSSHMGSPLRKATSTGGRQAASVLIVYRSYNRRAPVIKSTWRTCSCRSCCACVRLESRLHSSSNWCLALGCLAELFLDIRLRRPALRLALPSKVPTVLEAMLKTALAFKPSIAEQKADLPLP
jgi:hypothetical protein